MAPLRQLAYRLSTIWITFLRLSSRLSLSACSKYYKHSIYGAIPTFVGLPKYRKIVVMLEKLPYSKLVEKSVLEMIQGGVPIRQITHGAVVAL